MWLFPYNKNLEKNDKKGMKNLYSLDCRFFIPLTSTNIGKILTMLEESKQHLMLVK